MTWSCFGFMEQCRVGRSYFRDENKGLCIKDADQERYDGDTPFKIVFCVINVHSLSHPHRHVSGWRDGIFMWEVVMPNAWDHMELTYDMMADGIWSFKLQDSDTSEVLCSRMIGLNKDPIFEEEDPEEDVGEGVIDYNKIREIGHVLFTHVAGNLRGVDYHNDIDRYNNKIEVIDKINTQSDILVAGMDGLQANAHLATARLSGDIAGFGSWIQTCITGVSNQIEELEFPTMDSIKETFISAASEIADRILERVWDEIERRYEK